MSEDLTQIHQQLVKIESIVISVLNALTTSPTINDTRSLAMQMASGDKSALRNYNRLAKQKLSRQERS